MVINAEVLNELKKSLQLYITYLPVLIVEPENKVMIRDLPICNGQSFRTIPWG